MRLSGGQEIKSVTVTKAGLFLKNRRGRQKKESAACRGSGKGIYPYRGGGGVGESSVGNGAVAVYFDGEEDEYGAYLWILKPEMAAAFRELEEAEVSAENSVREALASDISSFGTEGNLFSSTADETVEKIRKVLEERSRFSANHFPKKRNAVSAGFTACLF